MAVLSGAASRRPSRRGLGGPRPGVDPRRGAGADLVLGLGAFVVLRLEGHQIRGPMSNTSAGTSTERTRKVSSSTPKAMMKPISVRNTSGSTARALNMPASTIPAEDDGAGDREAAQHADARAVAQGLLAHAGHQEDVVVDPQRHEEHERQQRERGVDAREVEDVLEEEDRCRARRRTRGSPRRRAAPGSAARAAGSPGSRARPGARGGSTTRCRDR